MSRALVISLISLVIATLASTQTQAAAMQLPGPPLGDVPFTFDTAEKQKIRVDIVTKGLSHPWARPFFPRGRCW